MAREAKGLSRRLLAERVGVDVTALASWERGAYLPRSAHRAALAAALGADLPSLFAPDASEPPDPANSAASLVDTLADLPALLREALDGCDCLRALRIAAPYATPAYIQKDFRLQVAARLQAGTLEVERIEVFYALDRLKEGLSNIFRYDGLRYSLKAFAPAGEVTPGMGGYFFGENRFVLGAYWTGVPPKNQPGLCLSGEPFRTFFMAYWDEIWRRGQLLNLKGAHDLAAVRSLARRLGLADADWPSFVEEARMLEVGDGAPPLP